MSKAYVTNEVMPDPNEVKPEALKEMGDFSDSGTIALVAVIGAFIVAAVILFAFLINIF